jgi:hypothetical protein
VSPGKYGWPIVDRVDLKAAVQSFGRAASSAGVSKVKAWITRRARALNALDLLPSSWGVKRSAPVLAPRDSDDLHEMLELLSPPRSERLLVAERRVQRAYGRQPEVELQNAIFDSYSRLIGS